MANSRVELWLAAAAAALISSAAAQEPSAAPIAPEAAQGEEPAPAEGAEPAEINPDEMADDLNSSQQLQQSFTLKRMIDGEVVETDKRTVTYSRDTPYRETEAGRTTVERLKAAFASEALTRTKAFEEAKLDFIIADKDRNELLSAQEFAALVAGWRDNEIRQGEAPNSEIARQRQYDAFLDEIDPEAAHMQSEAFAMKKFAFMAGAAETMTLQDYIREYLLDFDSMDADNDAVLTADELMRFRALNRGETLDM
jgi:hypothetical protein